MNRNDILTSTRSVVDTLNVVRKSNRVDKKYQVVSSSLLPILLGTE